MHPVLKAVLAADIVGYSRQMGEDAQGTLEKLRGLRNEILGPAIAANQGKIVKSMGDGWIVTFDAVANAVRCAMQVQDRLKLDSDMQLRLGIHLGDVTRENGDVFGEGINLATRLQVVADPGTLAISGTVRELLDGTLRPSFASAGKHTLKNIAEPVTIWVRGGDVAGGKQAIESDGLPLLAIVPVVTHSSREDVQDLAMALTGDLNTHLNAFRFLKCRTSQSPSHNEYQLHGVIRTQGDRIRLETNLIAPDGTEITARKYDGDFSDSFHWQDETGLAVGRDTLNRLLAFEVSTFANFGNEQCSAVQLILRMIVLGSTDGPGLGLMTNLASLAIEKKPDWGMPYAYALGLITLALSNGSRSFVEDHLGNLRHWQEKVDELEPPHSPARIVLTLSQLVRSGDREKARRDVRLIMRNLPFDPEALHWAAWVYAFSDDPQEAFSCLAQLDRSVPAQHALPSIANAKAMTHFLIGEYEEAITFTRHSADLSPADVGSQLIEAASQAMAGRTFEAERAMANALRLSPDFSMYQAGWRAGRSYPPAIERYFDGLRRAGLPEYGPSEAAGLIRTNQKATGAGST